MSEEFHIYYAEKNKFENEHGWAKNGHISKNINPPKKADDEVSQKTKNEWINMVKNSMVGILGEYEPIMIGEAFDNSFDNPQFDVYKSIHGKRMVTFHGNILKSLHERALNRLPKNYCLNYVIQNIDKLMCFEDWTLNDSYQMHMGMFVPHDGYIVQDFVDRVRALIDEYNIYNENKLQQIKSEILTLSKEAYWRTGSETFFQWIIKSKTDHIVLIYGSCTALSGWNLGIPDVLDVIFDKQFN